MSDSSHRSDKILRFRRSERVLHWCVAVPFLLCLATALVLILVYSPHPERPYRHLFSWIHRISGLCLMALPVLAILVHFRDLGVYLKNLKEGLSWGPADFKWLALKPLMMLKPDLALPEEGKFNAGEKINFTMTTLGWPLFGVTGLLIWGADHVLTPWLIHFSLATVSMVLIGGHIFMATINPDTRPGLSGMLSGLVDRRWASHHYRRWYKEEFGGPSRQPKGLRRRPTTREVVVKAGLTLSPAAMLLLAIGPASFTALGGYAAARFVNAQQRSAESWSYLVREQSLLAMPQAQAEKVGALARGAKVRHLGDFSGFALVQDAAGHTGYVPADLLAEQPLAELPRADFRDCRPHPGEPDAAACLARVESARQACRQTCAPVDPDCADDCERQYAGCRDGCRVEPAPAVGLPSAARATKPAAKVRGKSRGKSSGRRR